MVIKKLINLDIIQNGVDIGFTHTTITEIGVF
jgi:hypothetical protein